MQKIRDVDVKWGDQWLRGRIVAMDERQNVLTIQLFPGEDEPVPHMVVVTLTSKGKSWKEVDDGAKTNE